MVMGIIKNAAMILYSRNLTLLLFPFLGKMARGQGNCTITEMFEVIDSKFSTITAGTRVFLGTPPKYAQKYCLQMDYDSLDIFGLYYRLLNSIFPSCKTNPENETCKAIEETFYTFKELEDKGCTPIFRNYLPAWTDWYQNKTTCETGSFDYGTKEWTDENGCNLYSLCDIMMTILTLSANQQQTGTCGTTAMLTVLSKEGPVRALRLATETVWMGRTSYLQDEPCSYIYDQFPGVQPLPNPDSTIEEACGDTPNNDCKNFVNLIRNVKSFFDAPIFPQFPGIEFMMTQSFDTASRRHETGSCEPEVFQLIKPDFSNLDEVTSYQATNLDQLLYYCEGMTEDLGYSCDQIAGRVHLEDYSQTLVSPSNINWIVNKFSDTAWTEEQSNQIFEFLDNLDEKEVTDKVVQKFLSDTFCAINPNGLMTSQEIIDEVNNINSLPTFLSRIDIAQLNKACEYAEKNEVGVVMTMNSGPLNKVQHYFLNTVYRCEEGYEPYCDGQSDGEYPEMNHAVVLESCNIPKNEYYIWTWAKTLTLPREVLVADDLYGLGGTISYLFPMAPSEMNSKKVFEYENMRNGPTPCQEGFCHLFCPNDDDSSVQDSKKSFYVVFFMILCSSIWIL